MSSLDLSHVVLTPSQTTSAWRMTTGGARDLSGHQRLVMRLSQTANRGWSGLGLWVRLIDSSNEASWYRVWEPSAGGLLPEYNGLSPLDRMIDVHVPLDGFFAASGSAGVDRSRIAAVDLFLVQRDPARVSSVVADVIRFE
jgi:hypothetical protein